MADEQTEETAAVEETEAPASIPPDPAKPATHPPVLASAGQRCQVEGCPFIFGDPKFGVEPHPLQLVIAGKSIPKVEPIPPVAPPRPAPDPAACQPIGAQNECPTCHWSAATSAEPHPVL